MARSSKRSTGTSAPALHHLTVAEAQRALLAGAAKPIDLVEACLARIAAVDGRIHSYIHVAAERARARARKAGAEIAAGRWLGPLHGIPFGVKDNYDVAGLPATAASRLRLDNIPDRDAAVVARLEAAGAILIGKLATWEYGTGNGGEYFDLPFPPARNPWDPERFTGGSSTGAGASVAAGTAIFAMGSDTTGSVRLPAAATGVVGMIATPGRLPLDGILPNCYSFDVPGPFAWTVEGVAAILDVLAEPLPGEARGPSFRRDLGAGIAGMQVAVVTEPGPGMPHPDKALADAFAEGLGVLERLGARLTEVRLPVAVSECFNVTRLIGPTESAAIHEQDLQQRPHDMGFALRDKLLAGSMVRAVDYIAAQRRRKAIAASIDALMRGFDALVTFGPLHVAPRLGVEPEMTAFTVDTMLTPFNLAAQPALIQCTGYSAEGLPLNWQVAANRGDEAKALRLAHAYERATPWRERRPGL